MRYCRERGTASYPARVSAAVEDIRLDFCCWICLGHAVLFLLVCRELLGCVMIIFLLLLSVSHVRLSLLYFCCPSLCSTDCTG